MFYDLHYFSQPMCISFSSPSTKYQLLTSTLWQFLFRGDYFGRLSASKFWPSVDTLPTVQYISTTASYSGFTAPSYMALNTCSVGLEEFIRMPFFSWQPDHPKQGKHFRLVTVVNSLAI